MPRIRKPPEKAEREARAQELAASFAKRNGTAVIPGWTPKTLGHVKTSQSEELVEKLASHGTTDVEIAGVLNINPRTLWKHYAEQLTLGAHRANAAVAANLFDIATKKNGGAATVQAAIWWTKARMGWSEIRRVAADVRTIQTNARDLTDAELIEIIDRGSGTRGDSASPEE